MAPSTPVYLDISKDISEWLVKYFVAPPFVLLIFEPHSQHPSRHPRHPLPRINVVAAKHVKRSSRSGDVVEVDRSAAREIVDGTTVCRIMNYYEKDSNQVTVVTVGGLDITGFRGSFLW